MAGLQGFRRALSVAIGALFVAGLGALALTPPGARAIPARSVEQMADEIGAPVMEHLRRGHVAGRSGQVMLVPRPHHYLVGQWDLRTLWTATPETFVSHPNPWSYLTRVPIIFYGRDVARRGVQIEDPVDVADIAPTYADLLGVESFVTDGASLAGGLLNRSSKLRAIATIVLDGGGWNVLQNHPRAWPALANLVEAGTSYVNATVGSAPSLTGAIHSTMGTGRYPRAHGIPNNPWLTLADPGTLRIPTVSERWDEARGNKPVVAMSGFESPHVGMIGHGAQRPGGDRDVAVFWDSVHSRWRTNTAFYRLPGYLLPTDKDRLATYEREMDGSDGIEDGLLLDPELEEMRDPL